MLYAEVTQPIDISDFSRENMFKIMDSYYKNMKREKFETDLAEKTYVILLKNCENEIVGFTTLLLWDLYVDGIAIKGLYSGDTIVQKAYWGQTKLQSVLGKLMVQIYQEHTDSLVYWLLSSKGYKTYGMLPLYFLHFYPAYGQETPCFEKKIIDTYGVLKFGSSYEPVAGIAVNSGDRDYLREGVAELTETKLANKHIEFFREKNPGFTKGDELLCVAQMGINNFRPVVRRFMQYG